MAGTKAIGVPSTRRRIYWFGFDPHPDGTWVFVPDLPAFTHTLHGSSAWLQRFLNPCFTQLMVSFVVIIIIIIIFIIIPSSSFPVEFMEETWRIARLTIKARVNGYPIRYDETQESPRSPESL